MVGFCVDCVPFCLGDLRYCVYTIGVCLMYERHDVAQRVLRKQAELVGVPVIPYPILRLPPDVFCGYPTVGVFC